jgi:hypothetical protein
MDDPRGFLAQYPDGAVLDEIQRAPDLVSYIQPMVDEDLRDGLFILTGIQQLTGFPYLKQVTSFFCCSPIMEICPNA